MTCQAIECGQHLRTWWQSLSFFKLYLAWHGEMKQSQSVAKWSNPKVLLQLMKTAKRYPTWHAWSHHWVWCNTLVTWPTWWHMTNDAAITYWVSGKPLITQWGRFVRNILTCLMWCCLSCRLNFADNFCVKKQTSIWNMTYHLLAANFPYRCCGSSNQCPF